MFRRAVGGDVVRATKTLGVPVGMPGHAREILKEKIDGAYIKVEELASPLHEPEFLRKRGLLHWILRAAPEGVVDEAIAGYIEEKEATLLQKIGRTMRLDEPAIRVLKLPLDCGGEGVLGVDVAGMVTEGRDMEAKERMGTRDEGQEDVEKDLEP